MQSNRAYWLGLRLAKDLTAGIVASCVLAAVLALAKRGVPEEGS